MPLLPTNLSDHYFFRFGTVNHVFEKNYEFVDSKFPSIGLKQRGADAKTEFIDLAIYYNSFTVADFEFGKTCGFANLRASGPKKLSQNELRQVQIFFEAPAGSVFWLFLERHLVAVEATQLPPFDSPDPRLCDSNGTSPKVRKFKFLNGFLRFETPELFATTDCSNIQGTILNLTRLEAKVENVAIARAMLGGTTISLTDSLVALRYISPVQLETMLFKLFNDNGYLVTSCRGASRSKIDLHIFPDPILKSIPHFNTREAMLIQIKRTNSKPLKTILSEYLAEKIYFFTLDDKANRSPIVNSNSYFIGNDKLGDILKTPEAASTCGWLRAVLGGKYFQHLY